MWSKSSVIGTEELWSWVHYNPNKNFAGNVCFFCIYKSTPVFLIFVLKANTILFFSLLHCKLMFTLLCRKLKENNGTAIKIWQNFLRMNNIDRTKCVSSDFRRLKLSRWTACTPLDMLSAIRVEIELSLHMLQAPWVSLKFLGLTRSNWKPSTHFLGRAFLFQSLIKDIQGLSRHLWTLCTCWF